MVRIKRGPGYATPNHHLQLSHDDDNNNNNNNGTVPVLNELRTMPWRCMGSGCINPHFLDLGTSWRWVVSFTPRPHYPLWKTLTPDKGLGGSQSRSGRLGKNSWPYRDSNSNPSRPARSLSLYWIRYPGFNNNNNNSIIYVPIQRLQGQLQSTMQIR
jgi:hypothetical protein